MQSLKNRNSENSFYVRLCQRRGFSLIEVLTVLMLSAMILTAAILIFGRVRSSAAAITARLDRQGLPDEILQKIAEDIDRLAAPGFDASITIRNKADSGYNSAQLIIENRYYGSGQPPVAQIYERVVWQSSYDPYLGQMVLYRSHSGLNAEEKLDTASQSNEETPEKKKELFVPVCSGLTYFGVFALTGNETEEQEPASSWQKQAMPNGILLGLSLAPMMQQEDGSFLLPEGGIIYRDVAVDRTRPIAYKFVAKLEEPSDPNSKTKNDPNAVKSAADKTPDKKTDGTAGGTKIKK
jgi:prepilin-type N-terminal cleavage/methylation domain-containing protein